MSRLRTNKTSKDPRNNLLTKGRLRTVTKGLAAGSANEASGYTCFQTTSGTLISTHTHFPTYLVLPCFLLLCSVAAGSVVRRAVDRAWAFALLPVSPTLALSQCNNQAVNAHCGRTCASQRRTTELVPLNWRTGHWCNASVRATRDGRAGLFSDGADPPPENSLHLNSTSGRGALMH